MTDFPWLDPGEQSVFRSYARSTRALFVQFDRELEAEVGLPRTYFEILWLLNDAPDQAMRMSDLAAATGSQPSRISYAVSRLEKAGQVRRELCAEDRRGWYAVLTEAGREVLLVAAPVYAEMIRRYFFGPLSISLREQVAKAGDLILAGLARAGSTVLMIGADDDKMARARRPAGAVVRS